MRILVEPCLGGRDADFGQPVDGALASGLLVEAEMHAHRVDKLLAHGMSKVEDSDNDFTMGLDPELFVKFLDTPERIVLEFTPEMSIPFDGDKMAKGTAAAYAEFASKASKDE